MNYNLYLNQLTLDIKSRNARFINIRCPICGDSSTNRYKARGYILLGKDTPIYNCFNECGSMSFLNFLKQVDSRVAEQYQRDSKREWIEKKKQEQEQDWKALKSTPPETKEQEKYIYPFIQNIRTFDRMWYKATINEKEIENDFSITDLTDEAKQYLYSRGFKETDSFWNDFKFCPDSNDIIIPYWYNKEKNEIYGVQSRCITEKRFHLNFFGNPKVSNICSLHLENNQNPDVYVFESEFDRLSTGLMNSISSLGTSLNDEVYTYLTTILKRNLIFCYDADEAGDTGIMKYLKRGNSCLIHQPEMYHFKDFNKLLELGQPMQNISTYIQENIKSFRTGIIELKRRGIKN